MAKLLRLFLERFIGLIMLSVFENPCSRLEHIQTTRPAASSPPLIASPNGGETVKFDSSEQQSLVEFDAMNSGHVVSQDHNNSTGSHSKKKNTDHSKNNTKETLEIERRNKNVPSLEEIKRQFGNKREDAAKNLGVSLSTLKRLCRKCGINQWPFQKENKGSYKGKGVESGEGTSSSAQAACSAKCSAPTVSASSSHKQIRISSQIATQGTTSTEDAGAKSTDAIVHETDEHGDDRRTLHQPTNCSQPFRMLSLEKEKYSGFHKSQTSIVEKESKFTDFEEQTREVEGNKGESAGGDDGVEVEMPWAELVEIVINLPANQPSVDYVDIPSLAKEDAFPSELALVPSMITPERPPNPTYHFSFSETPLSLSPPLMTMTSADQTVLANFPLQGAVGAASAAAADPACSGLASNNVTQQSHLHEISKKSKFLGFEVSSNTFHLLMQIQQRFPETFTSFKIKRSEWAVPMLENLAEFVKSVADTKVHETSEETMQSMRGSLEDLEYMGFSLPWLKARLEDGTKVKKHNENNHAYEYSANALEQINGDIKRLDEDYDRSSSELRAKKEKLEVEIAKAKAGLEASGRDLPFSLCIGDSLLKDIIM